MWQMVNKCFLRLTLMKSHCHFAVSSFWNGCDWIAFLQHRVVEGLKAERQESGLSKVGGPIGCYGTRGFHFEQGGGFGLRGR